MHPLTSVFALPDRLAPKAGPALVAQDEEHLAAVADAVAQSVADLSDRLAAARRAPAGPGGQAVERDQEVRRLGARLRTLRRFGADLCLGRMVPADGSAPVYVGRLGLTDREGRRLLVDWRSAAAEPFFGATHAEPMGLVSRRRYRWAGGRVRDYWDEVFTPEGLEGHAALDDQSAFLAELAAARSPRMRDVLGTLQADQDAIVRAGSDGALVVDGGPGTGKTVVALHRTAYLLHSDPRLGHRRGGVLVVGPHEPYLAYVADVLPSLGEEGVRTCTLRDLVPEGTTAVEEPDPQVAALKASAEMVRAVEPAVRFSERPPTTRLLVGTPWADVPVGAADWAEAFDAVEPGTPHNEARDQVLDALLDALVDRYADGDDVPAAPLRRALGRDRDLLRTLGSSWPLLDATDLVADLWSVPAYLRLCAPWLTPEQVRLLQRPDPRAWTVSDLPLLDAARHRLGDPEASRRARREAAAVEAERARRADVVADLVASDGTEMQVMSMLRGADLESALLTGARGSAADPDPLAGPFAHVVVDEAQELTDAEWLMLLARCPSRSLTVVGDRAQARHGFTGTWQERLARVGLDRVRVATLTVGYRTPAPVMAEAEREVRAVLPDVTVPTSVRSGPPVVHGPVAELDAVVAGWLAEHAEGTACVVGAPGYAGPDGRVRSLPPELVKGLEFDLVVLVDPASWGGGVQGAVDRYVAMTRATRQLVVLTGG
ncbi:RNA polymerase recycling motor ATPase HelR [Cellulomonas telluris]|uniref:RNA polymerase recycling motor ATPase HelR n=1 Tax=Cellulomonas telluris TaxID=2306636 RepID=UPI0010A900BA|nr:RNA polymerase recycling motor ATPase HelR [Cellulomonas telluris]